MAEGGEQNQLGDIPALQKPAHQTQCEPCGGMDESEFAMFCDEIEYRTQNATTSRDHKLIDISLRQEPTTCPDEEHGSDIIEEGEHVSNQIIQNTSPMGTKTWYSFFSELTSNVRSRFIEKLGYRQDPAEEQSAPRQTAGGLTPGKPILSDVRSDSVTLTWEVPTNIEHGTGMYQVRFQESDQKRWNFYSDNPDRANVTITGLKSECTYIFQVRAILEDIEGPYGPVSDPVVTKSSLASRLLPFTTKVKDGQPSIHKIHSSEIKHCRNEKAKTRKFELGRQQISKSREKTILLVGATGSGKSTLVDGIINYVAGVNWKDPFRFTLIDLEEEEKHKNQAISQTEWITCYSINPEEGSRLDYRLNIIDTPGFGDTRGLHRDEMIASQIRELFSSPGSKGVVFIDAVCFLTKAPDARLTASQKYIFMSTLSLFGQDIEENICALITFADGEKPPVLAAMTEAKLPCRSWYLFNNSGLFAGNLEDKASLSPMFWEMGNESFHRFFLSLAEMPTKSLQQTKEVLEQRQLLEVKTCNLQKQVSAGLNKLNEMQQEIEVLNKNEREILDNKDFVYEVQETKQIKTDLPRGKHVTNCLNCNMTCHDDCCYAKDEDKEKCCVMKHGSCTVCIDKCAWNVHHNTSYIFTFVTQKVKKTYKEKMKMYKKAGEEKVTHEQVIQRMKKELDGVTMEVEELMVDVNACNSVLKEIALHPNPLSMVEHIDLMIQSEKIEKKDGFQDRIRILKEYRKKAEIHKDVDKLKLSYTQTVGRLEVSGRTTAL